MSTKAFIGFAIVLWVMPAIVAGSFGWPGIWGGGSAFGDLIVPAPITGGIVHVPSYIVTLAIVRSYPRLSNRVAAYVRAGFVVAALLGLAMIIDLERLHLSLSTDMRGDALRLDESYVGISILCDAVVAWVWLTIQRRNGNAR